MVLLVGLVVSTAATGGTAASYPVLPDTDWSPLLGGLTGPTLQPGSSGSISFQVGDRLAQPLTLPTVSLEVYAFTPTDGGTVQSPPPGPAPSLGGGGPVFNATHSSLPVGGNWTGTVPVSVPPTAATGEYAVRFALRFTMNGTAYLLESRGFFSAAAWAGATQYANGTPTINASQLGVSGVVPETSILVPTPSPAPVLYALLGVGLGLAALGAYWWTRSEAKSKSGARRSSPPQSAPTAFGSRRSSDGD